MLIYARTCSNGIDGSEQVEDVLSQEQPLSTGYSRNSCTTGSDSVEQAEDAPTFNSVMSWIVDPPPVMEDPSVYSFNMSPAVSIHTVRQTYIAGMY